MRHTTPPLHMLRAFESAARHGSFARAAEELGVTPSAVSQQVAKLEADLEMELFARIRKRLHLSEAGSSYYTALRAALDRIESATLDLIRHGDQEHVTIGALPSLASHWLIPRLEVFLKRRSPSVQIQIVTLELDFASTERAPDLKGGNIDLGLFYGDGHWQGLHAEKLMDERLIAVAAPRLCPGDRSPDADLARELPLLKHSTRPESWEQWFAGQEQAHREPTGPSFEHFYMLVQAAKAGLGIALVPDVYAHEEVSRGTLTRVSNHVLLAKNRAYYMVVEPERKDEPILLKMREWLRTQP